MFIRELSKEEFEANALFFEGMTVYFQSSAFKERKPTDGSDFYQVITAWENGVCIFLCLYRGDRYGDRLLCEPLEIRMRRFSHLGRLKQLKWILSGQGSTLTFMKKDLSTNLLSLLTALNFKQQTSSMSCVSFTLLDSPQTIKEVLHQKFSKVFDCYYPPAAFHPTIEELLKQFSPLEVQKAQSFIVKSYTQYYRDVFEMTGENWNVEYHAHFAIFAPTKEEACRQVEKRGYEVTYCQRGDRHNENSFKFHLSGVRYQTFDHKYNDQSLTYYRHVLNKHIYEYAQRLPFITSFCLNDKLGGSLIFHEMKRLFVAPIPKYMEAQLKKKVTDSLILESLTPWLTTQVYPCFTDYNYYLEDFKDLLVEIVKHQTPECLAWVKQQTEQLLTQDVSVFNQIFIKTLQLVKSNMLTPKGFETFLLSEQGAEIKFLISSTLLLLDAPLQKSDEGKELQKQLRHTCSRLSRKKELTLQSFQSVLETISLEVKENLTGGQHAALFFADYYLKGAVFLIQQNRQKEMVPFFHARGNDWLFANVVKKILKLFPVNDGEHVLSYYYKDALDQELRSGNFQKNPFSTEEIHDISYILKDFLESPFLTPETLKSILSTMRFKALKDIHPTLTSLSKNYSKKEMKSIQTYLTRQVSKHQQLTVDDLIQAEIRVNEKFIKQLGFSSEEQALVFNFLDRMNTYNERKTFSIHGVARTLGESFFKDCVNQKVPGTFTPQTFGYPKALIGDSIKQLLKTKDETVLNPKRLYHRLRQIKPVQSFIEGEFSSQEMELALEQLKIHTSKLEDIQVPARLIAKVESKCNPEFLIAGNASVCCMSFGNKNALSYAKEKGFGVLNIYYKERIIANSVLWLAFIDEMKVLILDNIEVHPNYKRFNAYIKTLYESLLPQLKETYDVDFVVQGAQYNDLVLFDRELHLRATSENLTPIDIELDDFYSDADAFYVLEQPSKARELINRLNDASSAQSNRTQVNDAPTYVNALPF